jgi:hypothetical protein
MIKVAALAWMLCMAGPSPCPYEHDNMFAAMGDVFAVLCLQGFLPTGQTQMIPADECGGLSSWASSTFLREEQDEADFAGCIEDGFTRPQCEDQREDRKRRPWVYDENHPDYCEVRPYLCEEVKQ